MRAAVALLDAEGLERVSMRRIAAELGVTVGALYWYVATTDELLELALDDVLGEARAPDDPGEWRGTLAAHAARMRQVLLRHPWALPLLSRLPNIGPNAVALRAGEPGRPASNRVRAYFLLDALRTADPATVDRAAMDHIELHLER